MKVSQILIEGTYSIKTGFYRVSKNFSLSAGAWRMNFKEDTILEYTSNGKLMAWDKNSDSWVPKSPSGDYFELNGYGESARLFAVFTKGTQSITKAEAKAFIAAQSTDGEKTLSIKDAIKYLQTLKSDDKVKIKLVK